jgi:ubiquinone/menaquinone biosynthesis C-methylase UbiE
MSEPRRSDFNTLADDYARFRTSYSPELFDAILAYARLSPGARILDLACGTGLGMTPYLERGYRAVGVDIAPAMIDQARQAMQQREGVEFALGSAEALPFDDACFDLVSCAQAFHWFEPHAAFAQIARVLRPGGALAAFWKHAARDDPFTLVAEQIIRQWLGHEAAMRSRDHAIEHESGWAIFWQHVAPDGEPTDGRAFIDGEEQIVEFSLARTPTQFVGYQRSREKIRTVLGARRDEFLAELDARLRARWPADEPVAQRQIQYAFLARKRSD